MTPPRRLVLTSDAMRLAEGEVHIVSVGGREVLVTRWRGRIHAVSATCPHRGGPLRHGLLASGLVVCPWHGSEFRIVDGVNVAGPAACALDTWHVDVEDGTAHVHLP